MSAIRRIVLVGPRAAGKSTLARALGARLGWRILDTDELIAVRVGSAASVFLAKSGEAAFRAVEQEVCVAALVAAPAPAVVALGGGAVLSVAVRVAMDRPDVFGVFLAAPVPVLARRQRAVPRPPLTGLPLEAEVKRLLDARRAHYEQVSRLQIDTKTSNVDACVASILDKMDPTT